MEPEEALQIILNNVNPVDHEMVHYSEALGRVLIEEVESRLNLPPYNNSAMDGFAFAYNDLETNNKLKIVGTIKAGDNARNLSLNKGECYRIMTGAPLPKNADTVVEFEKTQLIDGYIKIENNIKLGSNVRQKGEDVCEGDVLSDLTNKFLTPARIARLVSTGNFILKVNRKIRIKVISTGDELTYPCANIEENTIIESNSVYIKSILNKIGIETVYKGIVSDEYETIKRTIEDSKNCDAIITIGGISKGDYDIMSKYGEKIGIKWLFNKVNQKPGKPFSFGIFKDIPIFSFPGNPLSSAFCVFYYFFPAMRKMMGSSEIENKCFKAFLNEDYFKKNDRNVFLHVNIAFDNGTIAITPYKKQNANIINALSNSNGYTKIPSDLCGGIKKGTLLDVYTTEFEYL
jgi:molybdopterin molybdotransferase